jgi:hypothetical protein
VWLAVLLSTVAANPAGRQRRQISATAGSSVRSIAFVDVFNNRIRTFVFDWQLLLEAGLSSTSVELTSAAATATSGIESVF